MKLRSQFYNLIFCFLSTALGSAAMAKSVANKSFEVKPSRITNRVLLAEDKKNSLRVQILSVFQGPTGDFSNTVKLVLSISQTGDMSSTEANFELTGAVGLDSAKRIGPGIYQITYMDADIGMDKQVRTLDARKAISDVVNAKCGEFEICEINTSLEMK